MGSAGKHCRAAGHSRRRRRIGPRSSLSAPARDRTNKETIRAIPQYEATIFIASREQTKEYACAWLDVFGGLAGPSMGVAPHKENDIPFIFKDDSGATVFTNDFVYDPKADTWKWRMDNVDKGKATLFGTEKLVRSDAAK